MSEVADDSLGTLRSLELQVRNTIRQRADIERQLSNPDALRSATARARRDRDAVTSPLLDEAREKVAGDIAALHEQWRAIDKTARSLSRVEDLLVEAPAHVKAHRDALLADLPRARGARGRVGDSLVAAGLQSLIPDEVGGDGQG